MTKRQKNIVFYLELNLFTSYICGDNRANMTINKDKYSFYLVFAILLLLLIFNITLILILAYSGDDVLDRITLYLSITLFLIIVTIILLCVICKRCKNNYVRCEHITNIIHDCKTPIATINIVCQTLNDTDIDSEESLKYYSDIVKMESSRLVVMIENILSLIRLNDSHIDYNQIVDVDKVINESAASMNFLIDSLKGKIVLNLSSDVKYIKGNCDILQSIITNLINNAIKYSKTQPKIIVSATKVDEIIEIVISDNGIGIKKCELSRIFDKTYRVMSSGVSREGTGLGLYYVKENVEKMKGKINVNSSFGNGSEFRITLPIVK